MRGRVKKMKNEHNGNLCVSLVIQYSYILCYSWDSLSYLGHWEQQRGRPACPSM